MTVHSIVDQRSGGAEVHGGEGGEAAGEHQAQRRRRAVVTAAAGAEGVAEDQQHHRHRRVRRAALGEQVWLGEDLQRADQLEDQRHEQHGAQLRQRDVPDLAPDRGAVDLGGLVQLAVHPRQGGEVDDHRRPGRRPRGEEDDRRHRPRSVLEPWIRAESDPAEDRVERAGRAGVVEHPPQQDRGDRWDDHRQVGEPGVQAANRRTSLITRRG